MPRLNIVECALLLLGSCAWASVAHAHDAFEPDTSIVIWFALVLGAIGGGWSAVRDITRLVGLFNTLAVYVIALPATLTALWFNDPQQSLVVVFGAFAAFALALFLGIVLGLIPLIVGYVSGEFVVRRVITKGESATR